MKKALSVLLAIMMLFGALSVGASAQSTPIATDKWHQEGGPASMEQVVLYFNLNGCTLAGPVVVWNEETGLLEAQSNLKGSYVMVPQNSETMKPGMEVKLPSPTAPTNYKFDLWHCDFDGNDYAGNGKFIIPAGTAGTTITFIAGTSPTVVEEDTLTKVMNILIKIFGAIIGIIMYGGDTSAGVALMEKILGGVMG